LETLLERCWKQAYENQLAITAIAVVVGIVITMVFRRGDSPDTSSPSPEQPASPPAPFPARLRKTPATTARDVAKALEDDPPAADGETKSERALRIDNMPHRKPTVVKASQIRQLEEQLAQLQLSAASSGNQTAQPSSEAKQLAELISDDDDGYAQALKAIAEGDFEQADRLLKETQALLDETQEKKNEAQFKLLVAHMQNYSFAGRYREALTWCERVEPLAGEDPLVLNSIAFIYEKNTVYQKAELLYKRAVAMEEKALGPKHPDVATRLDNLAGMYRAQGKYAQAEQFYKRSLAIREESLGHNHPDVAQSLNNLAELCRVQGEHAQAELLYGRALGVWEKALGPDHPDVATGLNNLANLYRAQDKYEQAEPHYVRALEIRNTAFGGDHPLIASTLNSLALLYKAQGQFGQAEPLFQRAREIDETTYGPDHPNVARDLNNLATMYKDQNNYLKAEPLCAKALAILEKAYGPDHPRVRDCWRNLESLHKLQGR